MKKSVPSIHKKHCILDFFIDYDKIIPRLSAKLLWYNIGNCALTVGFLRTVYHAALTAEIILAYGSIVVMHRLVTDIMKPKSEK